MNQKFLQTCVWVETEMWVKGTNLFGVQVMKFSHF